MRGRIEAFNATLEGIAGARDAGLLPPPLVLCEGDAHLGRTPLAALLGGDEGGKLLLPTRAVATTSAIATAARSARTAVTAAVDEDLMEVDFDVGDVDAALKMVDGSSVRL